jgi:predicted secreted protein
MAFIGLGTTFAYDKRFVQPITAITKADPGVITLEDATDFADGDLVRILNVVGMVELNTGIFKLASKTGSTFELNDINDNEIDTTNYTTYVSGGVIEKWQASTNDFCAVGEINDIQPPAPTKETVDTTHMGSVGGYREFISGLKDGGEVTFNINFSYADYKVFKDNFENDDQPRRYRVQFPDDVTNPTTWYFDAVVTAIPPQAPTADKVVADITLKVSGKSDFTNIPV